MNHSMDNDIVKAFQEYSGIRFQEYGGEIELGELQTADGYEIYYVGDPHQLNYENEVFYYKPSFDNIMEIIMNSQNAGYEIEVGCYDLDDWFDEFDFIDWLTANADEDELVKLGLMEDEDKEA